MDDTIWRGDSLKTRRKASGSNCPSEPELTIVIVYSPVFGFCRE